MESLQNNVKRQFWKIISSIKNTKQYFYDRWLNGVVSVLFCKMSFFKVYQPQYIYTVKILPQSFLKINVSFIQSTIKIK